MDATKCPNKRECPNKINHVSAWPAFDRMLCPWCKVFYVRKPSK